MRCSSEIPSSLFEVSVEQIRLQNRLEFQKGQRQRVVSHALLYQDPVSTDMLDCIT